MKRTRPLVLAIASLVAGCHSNAGTGGADASTDASGGDGGTMIGDDGATAEDDAGDADAGLPVCSPLDASVPSDNCIFLGRCPEGCVSGTASAYACAATGTKVASYPSAFYLMLDPVAAIAYLPDAGPWDAGAYLSCAPQACVRWSLADHVNGGSGWLADPCANVDPTANQAWACPSYEGFQPPLAGCVNAGSGQQIGGAGTGVAPNVLWCCPPSGGTDGGTGTDGASDAGASDGGPDGGLDGASDGGGDDGPAEGGDDAAVDGSDDGGGDDGGAGAD
jgi:hypothetical protein